MNKVIRKRLEKNSRVDPGTGCRIWTGAVDKDGYGRVRTGFGSERKMKRSHRVAFEEYKRKIPRGKLVLHECDTPSCIEPGHLFLGTHGRNVRDKTGKNRQARGTSVSRSGEQHWRRRRGVLTETEVAAIRVAVGTLAAIGQQYGVSAKHVSRIRHGKRRA